MTRQPAINVDFLFIVTFHADSHFPILVGQPLQIFDLPVTFPAGDFVVDVTLVVEQNVFRYVVYLHPGRGGLGVEILVLLLDPGMFFDDIVMAVQTLSHRRNAREIGIGNVGVAILALNLFNPAVDVVTERNRLLGSQSGVRHCIEQDHKRTDEDGAGQRSE